MKQLESDFLSVPQTGLTTINVMYNQPPLETLLGLDDVTE